MKKYRRKGVKREHAVIEGFVELLEQLASLPEIKSIIPGRIWRSGGAGRRTGLFIQRETETGVKCIVKSAGSTQEVFVVANEPTAAADAIRRYLQAQGQG